jgi:hypothetical protein
MDPSQQPFDNLSPQEMATRPHLPRDSKELPSPQQLAELAARMPNDVDPVEAVQRAFDLYLASFQFLGAYEAARINGVAAKFGLRVSSCLPELPDFKQSEAGKRGLTVGIQHSELLLPERTLRFVQEGAQSDRRRLIKAFGSKTTVLKAMEMMGFGIAQKGWKEMLTNLQPFFRWVPRETETLFRADLDSFRKQKGKHLLDWDRAVHFSSLVWKFYSETGSILPKALEEFEGPIIDENND